MWRARSSTWLFLLPAVLTLLAVGLYPLLFALQISFRQYQLAKAYLPKNFVGFDNYLSVLQDPNFWGALSRTGTFLLAVLPLQIVLGLGIAMLLNAPGWGFLRAVTRVALVIPLATTYAVVGLIGRLVYNGDFGVANFALSEIGLTPLQWLGRPGSAFGAVASMDVWQWTPFVALVFLAGLSSVPGDIEDAASLETSNPFSIFWHIQLPYLLPGLTAILILRTADILKLFDMIFVMTRGGPGNATDLISIYIQRVGFRVFDQGVASAQAILLLILTVILARIYIRVFYREVGT